MIPRILLFCSIFFITYTSHGMEIVKKNKHKHQDTLPVDQQTYILKKLSKTQIIRLEGRKNFYAFSSKKNYKQFLTLPKEYRQPIADASNEIVGIIQQPPKWDWSFSRYMGTIIKLKWIIPEDKSKKSYLPKVLVRHDGWCYCA